MVGRAFLSAVALAQEERPTTIINFVPEAGSTTFNYPKDLLSSPKCSLMHECSRSLM